MPAGDYGSPGPSGPSGPAYTLSGKAPDLKNNLVASMAGA